MAKGWGHQAEGVTAIVVWSLQDSLRQMGIWTDLKVRKQAGGGVGEGEVRAKEGTEAGKRHNKETSLTGEE